MVKLRLVGTLIATTCTLISEWLERAERWKLIIHYTNCPRDTYVRYNNSSAHKVMYIRCE